MLIQWFLVTLVLAEGRTILPEAIKHAVAISFNGRADALQVVIETSSPENEEAFLDILDSIQLQEWSFQLQIIVNNVNSHSIGDYNLWFVDNYESFQRLLSRIHVYHKNTQLFIFIVLKHSAARSSRDVMQKMFSDLLLLMIANVNVIIETSPREVSLYTFYPFQKFNCRSPKPVLINQFRNNTMKHNGSLFPNKAYNLHGCPLRMSTRNFCFFTNMCIHLKLGFNDYTPIELVEKELFKELAFRMNFTSQLFKQEDGMGIFPNGTMTGSYKRLSNGKFDVMFGLLPNSPLPDHFFSYSMSYLSSWVVMAVLRYPLTHRRFAWLVVPFDTKIWICIFLIVTTLTAGYSHLTVKTRLLRVLNLKLRRTEFLNIFAFVLGIPIMKLPKKSVLRFVFVTFSLAVTVLQAAYRGKLFDAFQTLIEIRPHLNINELLAKNYTIYSYDYFVPLIKQLTGLENSEFKDIGTFGKNIKALYNPNDRSLLLAPYSYIYVFSSIEDLRNIIMQPLFVESACIRFQQHSIIVPRVNEIIMRMEENGLLARFKEDFYRLSRRSIAPKKSVKPEKSPIALESFVPTFYLMGGLNAVAGLIFVTEIVWNRLRSA